MDGNELAKRLQKAKGKCPNCGKTLIFARAAAKARAHNITDHVVACSRCGHVYAPTLLPPDQMLLETDVTATHLPILTNLDYLGSGGLIAAAIFIGLYLYFLVYAKQHGREDVPWQVLCIGVVCLVAGVVLLIYARRLRKRK